MENCCVITDMALGVILEDELDILNKISKKQGFHPLSYGVAVHVLVEEVTSIKNLSELRNYLMSNELTPRQANKRISQSLFKATHQIN